MTSAGSVGPVSHRAATGACLVLVALLSIAISGCSSLVKGGQSVASARSAVLAIPGVASAKFDFRGAYNGFQKQWDEAVEIDLKPGIQPKDTAAFISYVVSTTWSINEHKPGGISIVLTTTPQVNLDAIGKSAGWTYLVTNADDPSGVITESVSLTKELGAWPGTPPKKLEKTALIQAAAAQSGQ